MRRLRKVCVPLFAAMLAWLPLGTSAQDSVNEWKERLRRDLKELEAKHLSKKMLSGMRVHTYLHHDQFMNEDIVYQLSAEVLSITKQPDSTSKIIFGNFGRDEIFNFQGGRISDFPLKTPTVGTASFLWHEFDRPVPLVKGMIVYLGLDGDNAVRKFSYHQNGVVAVRQRPNGQWEELVRIKKAYDRQERLLLICANRTTRNPGSYDIVWNKKFGLCKGEWGDCGGPEDEAETLSSRSWRGFLPANVSGPRIKPGRDGWIAVEDLPSGSDDSVRQNMIPIEQFLPDGC